MENPEGTKVRFAKQDDFAWCAIQDAQIDRERIRLKIDNNEIIVAETSGHLVGYLRFQYIWEKLPYIGLIYVDPEHRYGGVGHSMLKYLEDYLRLRSYRVLLSSSMVDEPEPQEWHRKMGFQECGFLTGISESGIGEVFFRKSIC
jgi:L-amino acid N-acyltransferase YncA